MNFNKSYAASGCHAGESRETGQVTVILGPFDGLAATDGTAARAGQAPGRPATQTHWIAGPGSTGEPET